MGESKEGVEDLALAEGFSVVDSTKNTEGTIVAEDTPKAPEPEVKEDEKVEDEKIEAEGKEEEESKVNGDTTLVGDATLVITAEEDLELTVDKGKEGGSEDTNKVEEDTSKNKEKTGRKQGDVWVSNITRHVKATDLKKHFTKHGKVLTAKIVTNGKSFFGYILMETGEIANKCVKALHGSTLDGRKITVSRQRPDQRRSTITTTTASERPKAVKTTTTTNISKKQSAEEKKEKEKEKPEKDTKRESRERDKEALIFARRNEERLKREAEFMRREVTRLKRSLGEEQRRLRIETQKTRNLGRELQEAENKMREERRKFDRDRDNFEKSQRIDRVKLEADRSLIKKELEEVKKLREYLKRKLDEESSRAAEQRRPRAGSPYAYSSKRFRESTDKGSKYVEERTRTPPSPPKLSSRVKARSPPNSFEKDRRSAHYEREIEGRHGSALVIPAKPAVPAAPRNIWPSTFHQEVWRMGPSGGPSNSSPFTSGQSSSYSRQSEYGSSKSASYQSRDFSKREHYSSSSVRKY